MSSSVRVGLLGPLVVWGAGGAVTIGAPKQRALLSVLALEVGRTVSSDELADKMWAGDPPDSAGAALQVYVSQLRKLLGSDAISTRRPGYALAVPPQAVDVVCFEQLVAAGRSAMASGDHARALGLLSEALSLWRGRVLEEFSYQDWAAEACRRLEEVRLGATEERIEAELDLGRGAGLASELEALVREHPLRERLRAQQMLALYRSGRQADALAVYRATRTVLVDELGIEPGPSLLDLHQRILRHDRSLDDVRSQGDVGSISRGRSPRPTMPVDQDSRMGLAGGRVGAVIVASMVALSLVVGMALTRGSFPTSSSPHPLRVAGGVAGSTIQLYTPMLTTHQVDMPPKGESRGDETINRGLLRFERTNRRAGRMNVDCTVQTNTGNQVHCSGVITLGNGTIDVAGNDSPHAPTVSFGIIGGTGAYNDARGELTGVPEPAGRIGISIDLVRSRA
jgi:DNA-binding SARP family transcriptional activator